MDCRSPPEIYLRVNDDASLTFDKGNRSDQAGGICAPSIKIAALSRTIGVVSAGSYTDESGTHDIDSSLEDAAKDNFNPLSYFSDVLNSNLLGGITLKDILLTLGSKMTSDAPKWVTENPTGGKTFSLNWKTTNLKPALVFIPNDNKGEILPEPLPEDKKSVLDLNATAVVSVSDVSTKTDASLTNFAINIFEVIKLHFEKISFVSENGNFSDPPQFDISPEGISASYSLRLPPITVGVFSLQNIGLSAGFSLPFTGDPVSFRFGFCDRNDPFILTITIFGGGGFFAITASSAGTCLQRQCRTDSAA